MRRTPAIAALAAVALAVVGCSSSSSSSAAGGGSSSSASGGTGRHLLEPPAAGSLDRADRSAGQRNEARALSGGRQGRAVDGELPVARRLDRRGRQVGPRPDGRQRAQGGYGPEGRLLHRRVQLGRQRGVDPDPQPGGNPPGEPGEHVRRPDDEPARQRPRRAAEVLPERDPYLPADRADRLDPGRLRPDRDEAGRLHEGRRGQRQGGVRRRAWPRCSSWRRAFTGSTS